MTPSARPSLPRAFAIGVAGLGIVGALAGCSTDASGSAGSSSGSGQTVKGSSDSSSSAAPAAGASYKDGSYTESGSYVSPGGTESVTVKLTIAGNKVTAVDVTGKTTDSTAKGYQSQFIQGISDEVVGKDLDTLKVSRVAGSSLTSGGFNKAVTAIKADALAS